MQDYILEMKDISKIYGNGIAANKDVDFNLKKGEIQIGRASCRERVSSYV